MIRHSMLVVYRCSMTILVIGLLGQFVAGIVDAGVNTWTTIGPSGESIEALAIAPNTPTTIYAGSYVNGVFKSTDGGEHWTAINTGGLTGTEVYALAIESHTPATVYAGSWGGGVFKSTNGGENWTAIDKGLTGTIVEALAIDSHTPATVYAVLDRTGVFKSTDGGENWTDITTDLPTGIEGFLLYEALAIDPDTPATVYVGSNNQGVFKSTNGGGSWTATGLTFTEVRTLAIDPETPTTIYAGTISQGVFKSTNGGENWTAINKGLTGSEVLSLAIDPETPTTIYAGTLGGGVFKSTNGGENWTTFNTGLTNTNVLSLAIDPMNPSILYAGTDGNGVFQIEQGTCPTPGVVSNPSPSDQATNVSTNPTLSWSGSSNVDSYDVYFGTTSVPTTLVGSSTSTSFSRSGLNLNTTYYWQIVAKNSCGNSTSGPVWSFTTGSAPSSAYSLTVTMSGTGSGTVTSSPAGINCGSECSETFQKPTNAKLTAKADSGSTFTGWSGGGYSGTKPCQVTVNSAITITATFDKKVPHISVSGNSLDFGSVKVGKSLKKTLKITNNGTGDLTVSIGGVGGTNFSVAGSTSVTVKPNKSYSLGITFKPSSKGNETAALVLTTNDPADATVHISLTGTGT